MGQTAWEITLGSVMHDSDSGIGIDSGIILLLAGIEIGIKNFKKPWNRNRNRKFQKALESDFQSQPGIGIGIRLSKSVWNRNRNRNPAFRVILESESESRHCRNRASLTGIQCNDCENNALF